MLIDTSQIQCFLAIAKYLNFTKAASELYLSQPVISRKLAALEKELGVILVDRTTRNISLTSEGIKFQKFFSDYITGIDTLLEEIEEEHKSENGRISIGIFEGWDLTEFLRSLIYDFRIQYENVTIYLDSGTPLQLMEGLKNGKFDALIMLNVTADALIKLGCIQDVYVDSLLEIEKCIIYSKNNPLAQKEDLTLEDFKDQIFFCLENEQVPRKVTTSQKLFEAAGFRPKVEMLKSVDAISVALLTGTGYAILDDATRIFNYRGIRHVMLGESHIISLVTPKKHRQSIETLRTYLLNKYCDKKEA